MQEPAASAELVEEVDIEAYAKEGRPVPRARRYRIRIDREGKVVQVPGMIGKEILALVSKTPETHTLRLHVRGGTPRKIAPDERVDFTHPGVERFSTMSKEQTDG